jgi:hypothetical protein
LVSESGPGSGEAGASSVVGSEEQEPSEARKPEGPKRRVAADEPVKRPVKRPWWLRRYTFTGTAVGHGPGLSQLVDTPGGPQRMVCVPEAGMWSLMLISRSPKVKPSSTQPTSLPTIELIRVTRRAVAANAFVNRCRCRRD